MKYVYFLEAVGADRVKIGESEDPLARVCTFSTGCPFPVRLIQLVRGRFENEKHFHDIFSEYRFHKQEWFDLPPILEDIRRLRSVELPLYGRKPHRVVAAYVEYFKEKQEAAAEEQLKAQREWEVLKMEKEFAARGLTAPKYNFRPGSVWDYLNGKTDLGAGRHALEELALSDRGTGRRWSL